MFSKIPAILKVFQHGEIVSNPEAWKRGQITSSYLLVVLTAIVGACKAFGYDVPLTEEQLNYIASGVLSGYGVYNTIATVVSTKKIGINP